MVALKIGKSGCILAVARSNNGRKADPRSHFRLPFAHYEQDFCPSYVYTACDWCGSVLHALSIKCERDIAEAGDWRVLKLVGVQEY